MKPIKKVGGFSLSGELTDAEWASMYGNAIQGCLETTGQLVVNAMREKTRPHDSSGRLSDSITYQTAKGGSQVGSAAKESDKIGKPTAKNEVWVGSNAPSAVPREEGAGTHKNREGHEEFIASMKEWVRRELGIEPDGAPEERARFWAIINHIRHDGLPAVPFVSTTKEEAGKYLSATFQKMFATEMKKRRK